MQGGYHQFWGGVNTVGHFLQTGIEAGAALNPVTSFGIALNKAGQGKYGQAAAFALPVVGAFGGEGAAAGDAAAAEGGSAPQVAYRYASETEANIAEESGFVPNTNVRGDPKFVFLSPNRYETSSQVESALQVGRFNPMGATPAPTHVIEVDLNSVPLLYAGNVENGTGIEAVTEGSPRVLSVRKLGE